MSHPAHDPRGPGAAEARARIGFVGLGAMGSRIAGRLLDAGHPVHGTNRTARQGQAADRARHGLAEHGARGGSLGRRRAQHGHRRRGARSDHDRARRACWPASERDRSTWT